MYYHPSILPGMTPERALNASRALADVWFDGIERHGGVHADAMKAFCELHVETCERSRRRTMVPGASGPAPAT